ncbi:unnamed protein product [Cylicocyclus nassatus]|uniref:Uncharacterized protein n=1 Tax=Cylicocyclus nassatus TaxID=53992 RepID=A0AA36M1A6_CYLNA|nr:unnamed protein product [Cylicocyclus nassatus]
MLFVLRHPPFKGTKRRRYINRTVGTLLDVADDATVKGHQAKELRNATAKAISDTWKDSRLATAAMAALDSLVDDKVSHWGIATVPNLTAYPIRLDFRLDNMASEAGWMSNRSISLWIVGASSISRAQIRSVETRAHENLLIIITQAFP